MNKVTALPAGSYEEFEIARKHKTPRKICAPNLKLLTYQRSKLKELVRTFHYLEENENVKDIMHGFIPDRNCVTAARKHVGFDITIMMDIVAFFDNVTKSHTNIDDDNFYHVEGYTAQGFATSPILACIGVIDVVKAIDNYLKDLVADGKIKKYAFTLYADDVCISFS